MSEATDKAKQHARHEAKRRYWDFLEQRITELHRSGEAPGRLAREQADKEYAAIRKAAQ